MEIGILIVLLLLLIVQTAFFTFLVLFLVPKWVPMKERKARRQMQALRAKKEALREEIDTYAG